VTEIARGVLLQQFPVTGFGYVLQYLEVLCMVEVNNNRPWNILCIFCAGAIGSGGDPAAIRLQAENH
jgi:hypothetical protein